MSVTATQQLNFSHLARFETKNIARNVSASTGMRHGSKFYSSALRRRKLDTDFSRSRALCKFVVRKNHAA